MLRSVLSLLLIAWLPGALLYRAPIAQRDRRAALPAEERLFWAIVISIVFSSIATLGLAIAHRYSFTRLLLACGALSTVITLIWGPRLRYRGTAPRPTLTALVPLALVALGLWLYFPPAEYIMGGKDPGTYFNEGIQLAQRGAVVITDETVAGVPPPLRDLFFPKHEELNTPLFYYGTRFMGFFVMDPAEGTVLGQFPHLFPSWIAIGYGLDGLNGALRVPGAWAILGLLAVYFAGARLFGRPAAAAGAGLVAINLIQVWFGRYPNAEMVMQTLLFAALLAWSRAQVDDDGFFAPVAGTLLALLLFLRFDTVLAFAGILVALALGLATGKRPRRSFLIAFGIGCLLGGAYLLGVMQPYMALPIVFARSLHVWQWLLLVAGAIGLAALAWGAHRLPPVRRLEGALPSLLIIVIVSLAIYAWFFRTVGGKTAVHDAMALRTFGWYVTPVGVAAALAGYVLAMRARFRRDPVLLATVTVFALFFFYKIRIVPDHFWMARRFLPVILPGAMLLVGYAAFGGFGPRDGDRDDDADGRSRDAAGGARGEGGDDGDGAGRTQAAANAAGAHRAGRRRETMGGIARAVIGAVVVAGLAVQFWQASRPVAQHVEYAGLIPRIEQLAGTFGDRDLVLVESRNASDLHVLALPLAYIYARNVLVLNSPRPDPEMFQAFLTWAQAHYARVLFMGGGGTDLLSRTIGIKAIASDRFQIPEWESASNRLPRGLTHKEFDFSVYEFVSGSAAAPPAQPAALDIGVEDDLNVVRFHAKERDAHGVTYRWTRDVSYISLLGLRPESQTLVLVLNDGHRPGKVPRALVQVTLDETVLGSVEVTPDFHTYTLPIPPTLAAAAAAGQAPARLKLSTNVWVPRQVLGTPDDRELGVMVDRVEVR